uniref:IS3 family transposase n=1 Tax=Neokomagataea thailandica TaxID=661190 RepID=UPI002265B8D3|nr:IS3 family transposase [Neokomagataea thailandica]
MLTHIREYYTLSHQTYGRPRMTADLKVAGLEVGERRAGWLMKANGIRLIRTRRHKVTTDSRHTLSFADKLQDCNFQAAAPNQNWAGDISAIWTNEGWLYLTVAIDLFSRRVIGELPRAFWRQKVRRGRVDL